MTEPTKAAMERVFAWKQKQLLYPMTHTLPVCALSPSNSTARTLIMPLVKDEPALWASIPDRLKPNVDAAAKAMCRLRDEGDEHERGTPCNCDPSRGGDCLAFGLWGHQAIAAVTAIDDLQMMRLHSGLFGTSES